MKKVISLALFSATLAFSQAGIMGGTDGLHQINANTLGQWKVNFGTGGNITFGSWGLSRGGVYEANGKRYSFNDADASLSGNFFASVGILDIVDIGLSLPLYYDHANSKGPSGEGNMWTTSRGDLDLFTKIGLPLFLQKTDSSRPPLCSTFMFRRVNRVPVCAPVTLGI